MIPVFVKQDTRATIYLEGLTHTAPPRGRWWWSPLLPGFNRVAIWEHAIYFLVNAPEKLATLIGRMCKAYERDASRSLGGLDMAIQSHIEYGRLLLTVGHTMVVTLGMLEMAGFQLQRAGRLRIDIFSWSFATLRDALHEGPLEKVPPLALLCPAEPAFWSQEEGCPFETFAAALSMESPMELRVSAYLLHDQILSVGVDRFPTEILDALYIYTFEWFSFLIDRDVLAFDGKPFRQMGQAE